MAGARRIVVEFLGDGKNLSNTLGDIEGRSGKFGRTMASVGKTAALGLAAGLGLATVAGVDFAKAAVADEQAATLLAGALERNANASPKQVAAVENWITAIGKAKGVADDDLRPALARLVTATGDVEEAQRLAQIAMDVSAGSGKSLESVSTALMKAQNGQVSSLSRLGINTKNAAGETITMEQATKRMADQFGGAASEKAQTLQGKMDRLKIIFDETKEAIGARLLPVVSTLADFLVDKVAPKIGPIADDFGRIAGIGWGKVKDAAGYVKDLYEKAKPFVGLGWDKVQDAARFMRKLADSAGDALAPLTNLKDFDSETFGKNLGAAVASGMNALIDLAGTITAKLAELFAKVDWVGLGIGMGKQVPALLTGLAVGILAFDPLPILSGLADHWQEVLLAVLTIAFAPAKIGAGLARVLGKIPFVGKFLAASVTWLNELGGKVVSFGSDLFGAMWRGFTGGAALPGAGVVSKVLAGIKGIPGAVKNFIDDLATKLGVWALDAFEAIGRGARNATGGIVSFVGSIPGRIINAIGDVAKLLFPKGVAAIEGMADGIRGRWEGVIGFLKGIPGRVLSGVGNLGSVLWNAGAAIIQGLIDGVTSKIGQLEGLFKSITGKIPKWKGPADKDAILLKPAGVAIMKGLVDGINKGKVELQTVLDKLTDFIAKKGDKLAGLLDKRRAIIDSFKGMTSSIFGADLGYDASKQRQDEIASLQAENADLLKKIQEGGPDDSYDKRAANSQRIDALQAQESSAPKGLDAILAFGAKQRERAESLNNNVQALIAKGLSQDLLTQLMGAGEAGQEQIGLLATATQDQIAQANADNLATQQALQAAGMEASKALGVEADIKAAERDIKNATLLKGMFKELLDEQDKNTVVELHLDGHRILWSLKKIKRQNGGHLGLGDTDKD